MKPRRIAPAVIVAVCLLAGGALLVFAIVAYVRGPHLIVAADTRSESDAAIVVETSDAETTVATSDAAAMTPPTATIDAQVDAMPDGSPSAAARCIDEAEGYIQAVRDGLASGDKIRRVREEWAHAKASIGEGVGAEYDKCREARLDRRRDSTDATLDELVVEIKTRESAHQLEYGYIDESGTAIYKDFRGNFLTTEQTDAH